MKIIKYTEKETFIRASLFRKNSCQITFGRSHLDDPNQITPHVLDLSYERRRNLIVFFYGIFLVEQITKLPHQYFVWRKGNPLQLPFFAASFTNRIQLTIRNVILWQSRGIGLVNFLYHKKFVDIWCVNYYFYMAAKFCHPQ